MCTAIALPADELPDLTLELLADRVYTRHGGGREVRFYYRACPALLPVWWNGRLHLVRWGNRDRHERRLPPTGWTWRQTVEAGRWSALEPEEVLVPANYIFAGGVWVRVRQGVNGLIVRSQAGEPCVFLVTEPSTRYYRVMCREEWMPSLVGEVI